MTAIRIALAVATLALAACGGNPPPPPAPAITYEPPKVAPPAPPKTYQAPPPKTYGAYGQPAYNPAFWQGYQCVRRDGAGNLVPADPARCPPR